jgi:hypothetical protein
MKPPVLPLIVACVFQSSMLVAQTAEKALLKFESYAFSMGVNNHEQILVGTWMGEVAFPDSIKGFWRKASVTPGDGTIVNSPLIDNVCYFNTDTAFVSGFINNKGKYNIIYQTVNGGKSWKPIDFGMDGWVDDAAYLDNGEAWLSVSGKGIAYTKDYGFTWSALPSANIKERFAKIYYNNKREGIIGSLRNIMAYTPDNCNTWITIPTPLSQDKYKKTNPQGRPEINRVAIYKNYLLVSQEKLVFYSKKDTVNWVFMPGYTDFYTDPENKALFFKTSSGGFIKSDDHFQPVSTFKNIGNAFSAVCRHGSLFVLDYKKVSQINASNKLIEFPLYTNRIADEEPTVFSYTMNGNLGSIGNKIYKQKEYPGKWNYAFTLPFAVDSGSLSMKDSGTVLFSRNDDSLFYYSIADAKVERSTKDEVMKSFCAKGIQTIVFSKGSQGCFHHSSDEMVYELEGESFVLSKKTNPQAGQTIYLKDNADEIDKQAVQEFVMKIPVFYQRLATINDLGFTQKEYDACKRNILAYKTFLESRRNKEKARAKEREGAFTFPVNNLDFNKLISLVDSVKTVEQTVLTSYLISSELWSTTSFWAKIVLINADDEQLEIKNTYYEPTAFYFPWVISVKGTTSTTTSIEINRFLNSVFPRFLDCDNRVNVIQGIVKELYRRQE